MPVQVRDPFTGQVTTKTLPVEVEIDEALLQRIAERTGGEFFRATDAGSLRGIFDRIDRLEKSEIKLTAYRQYRELFPRLLLLCAVSFVLSGGFFLAGLRVAPV
jgi:Ca-activated chloride channel family protein